MVTVNFSILVSIICTCTAKVLIALIKSAFDYMAKKKVAEEETKRTLILKNANVSFYNVDTKNKQFNRKKNSKLLFNRAK